jgi:hypothetical protein
MGVVREIWLVLLLLHAMQCSAVQTPFSFPGLCFAFASLRLQLFPQPSGVPPASALFDSSDLEVMQYK